MNDLQEARAKMKCVMKNWDASIFIPIYTRKDLINVSTKNRLLHLILILKKIFEMGTTVKLVTIIPDEAEQHRFNDKFMALTPVAMIVLASSLQYVIKILLYLIKAYDLVQRGKIMAIFDEDRIVETAGILSTLMQPSTVTRMGDDNKLKNVLNFGLTQGGPESPALQNKTESVIIRRVLQTINTADDKTCPESLKSFADVITL